VKKKSVTRKNKKINNNQSPIVNNKEVNDNNINVVNNDHINET
jgi:hypothetical protein